MTVYKYNSGQLPNKLNRNEFLQPFDAVFDQILQSSFPDLYKDLGVGFFGKQSYPKVNVEDFSNRVEIHAEIPGLKKEEVSVEVDENILSIKGKKKETFSDKSEQKTYILRELKHSNFTRSFTIGDNIDADNLIAKFENGILSVTMYKKTPKKPKIKQVKIG